MKNHYYLYIEPYVFLNIKYNSIIFYNSLNGKKIEYINNVEITKLARKLDSKNNLLVIELEKEEIKKFEISAFIKKIRKYYFGDLIKCTDSDKKPIQLKPYLNIQKGVEFLKNSPELNVGRRMMIYLMELTIYINGTCDSNCNNCNNSYKQFLFCKKNENHDNELEIKSIMNIIEDLKGTSIKKINISGGNIIKYSKINELNELVSDYATIVEYNIHYYNIYNNTNKVSNLNRNSKINVLVDSNFNTEILDKVIKQLNIISINAKYSFIVSKNDELYKIEKFISESGIEEYTIYPYFNDSNINFFKKNVFITKKDIFEAEPTQNDIFMRQTFNPLNFGKLYIDNSGSIFTNFNNLPLGNINNISIYDAIFIEMNNGKSWWKIRSKVQPCNNCLYNLLCSPISNYEYCIGKFNLCNIN